MKGGRRIGNGCLWGAMKKESGIITEVALHKGGVGVVLAMEYHRVQSWIGPDIINIDIPIIEL